MEASTGSVSTRRSRAGCSPCTQVLCGILAWESDHCLETEGKTEASLLGKVRQEPSIRGYGLCMALYSCNEGAAAGRWQGCICISAGTCSLLCSFNVCSFLSSSYDEGNDSFPPFGKRDKPESVRSKEKSSHSKEQGAFYEGIC